MPYICLASLLAKNVQITDLYPNASQNNNPTTGPPQSRYLRTDGVQTASTDSRGNVTGAGAEANKPYFDGIGAYLVDRIEPGADEVAEATVTLTGVVAGDQITVKTMVFEFAAGANDLAHAGTSADPFIVGLGASDNAAAANLTLAFNDVANVHVPMTGIDVTNTHTEATNVAAPSAEVLIQPQTGNATLVKGGSGDFAVEVSNPTRLLLDASSAAVGHLVRVNGAWTGTNLKAVSQALFDRVAAGSSLLKADIETVLATVSADLEGDLASSSSNGTVADILSIFAGRVYRIHAGVNKFTASLGTDNASVWVSASAGGFTTEVFRFDTTFVGGEWGASGPSFKFAGQAAKGGDSTQVEVGAARKTYDSASFQNSLETGQLFQYSSGITLFPHATYQSQIAPNDRGLRDPQETLTGVRVLTVYADDGSVLA